MYNTPQVAKSSRNGLSITTIIGIVLVILKIAGLIEMSWFWVLAWFWMPTGIVMILMVAFFAVGLTFVTIQHYGQRIGWKRAARRREKQALRY